MTKRNCHYCLHYDEIEVTCNKPTWRGQKYKEEHNKKLKDPQYINKPKKCFN